MKFCIAITEMLRKEVVVEASSLDEAFEIVEDAYNAEEIVLSGDDFITNPHTGNSVDYKQADWHSNEDIQKMKIFNGDKELSE